MEDQNRRALDEDKEGQSKITILENEEQQLNTITGQLKSINLNLKSEKRAARGDLAWYYVFFIVLGIILLAQFLQTRKIFQILKTTPTATEQSQSAPAPTATQNDANNGMDDQATADASQVTEPKKYSNLIEWIDQGHSPEIKIYLIKTDNALEEISPVLDGLYFIEFNKFDLEGNAVARDFHVEVNISIPDLVVEKMGCLALNFGSDNILNCQIELGKPIALDLNIKFATQVDGTSPSDCPAMTLGSTFYKDVTDHTIKVAWVADDTGADIKEFSSAEIISNLVMLNSPVQIGTAYATACEAVLILGQLPKVGATPLVYSFRAESEGNIPLTSLQLSPRYLEWLSSAP